MYNSTNSRPFQATQGLPGALGALPGAVPGVPRYYNAAGAAMVGALGGRDDVGCGGIEGCNEQKVKILMFTILSILVYISYIYI